MNWLQEKLSGLMVSRSLPKAAAVIGQAAAAVYIAHQPALMNALGPVGVKLNLDPTTVANYAQWAALGLFHVIGHGLAAKWPGLFGWLGAATHDAGENAVGI